MKLTKKNIVIDEVDISYLDNEQLNKKTLLFVHGWGADKYNLAAIYNFLSIDYRVIAVDLPGFGESGLNDKITDAFSYSVIISKFIEKLGIKKVNYIGHSFGGKIGIILASKNRDLIDKLVLVNSSGLKPKRNPLWYLKVYSFKILKFFYTIIIRDKEKIEKFKNRFGSTDYKNSGRLRKILVNTVNEDLTNLISEINIPTFLYWGDKDRDTPIWMAKKMNILIKDSGLYIVKNGGHFSFVDDNRIINII
ncbi:MAG TPA: alpha/beta hydrolase, partial [Spirochaetota bacterium]|nr:alpha/beta hydrolase [Spirochaetota bacterium]